MKRPSLTRRLLGSIVPILALWFAPARFEVEALAEIERLWLWGWGRK